MQTGIWRKAQNQFRQLFSSKQHLCHCGRKRKRFNESAMGLSTSFHGVLLRTLTPKSRWPVRWRTEKLHFCCSVVGTYIRSGTLTFSRSIWNCAPAFTCSFFAKNSLQTNRQMCVDFITLDIYSLSFMRQFSAVSTRGCPIRKSTVSKFSTYLYVG